MTTIQAPTAATVLREGLVRAGDISLYVTQTGTLTGLPVLWLHGGGPGASGMSNFGSTVAAFEDFHNIVVDMPRFGRSDKPDFSESILEFNAARIAALLETLGLANVSIVGNSLGGGTAARIAIDRPDVVDRLILMAPGGAMTPGSEPTPGIKLIFEYGTKGPDEGRMRRFLSGMVYDQSLITDALVAERYQASVESASKPGIAGPIGDLTPLLEKIDAPTLLLWGREDRTLLVEWGLIFENGIRDARFDVVPRCGHWVQVEQAAFFNARCRTFLSAPRELATLS